MKKELEFSVFAHGEEALQLLQTILKEFTQKTGVNVHLNVFEWAGDWARTVEIGLYNEGPDISEVGNTWIGDFTRMNALRPFNNAEVQAIDAKKFVDASWQCGSVRNTLGNPITNAIPWVADSRILVYKKDILAAAGVNMPEAFQDFSHMEQTLQAMKDAGIEHPFVTPTQRARLNLHHLAYFVWGAGGHFFNTETNKIRFTEPASLQGFTQYFRLGKFLSPEMQGLTEAASDEQFWNGPAAATITGPWLFADNRLKDQLDHWGAVILPGTPFVGGFHLVIWKHTRMEREAFRLVEFLTSEAISRRLFPLFGLPVHKAVLQDEQLVQDPKYLALARSLQAGRSFPTGNLWGLVENRLVDVLPHIWKETLAANPADIQKIIEKYLLPLERRLAIALNS